MIVTKSDLKKTIKLERQKNSYLIKSKKDKFLIYFTKCPTYFILKYLRLLRITEYYYNSRKKNFFYAILYLFYRNKKNKLGQKLGIEIFENSFDEGLVIFHFAGGIVVNANVKVGKNCELHGGNCIGNNGFNNLCPKLGDNVKLGVGSKVVGNVSIGDNVIIGAGAVVIKSFRSNCTLVGVPAKEVLKVKQR